MIGGAEHAALRFRVVRPSLGLVVTAALEGVAGLNLEYALDAELDLDVSLARGLNYYTGTIIEVKPKMWP